MPIMPAPTTRTDSLWNESFMDAVNERVLILLYECGLAANIGMACDAWDNPTLVIDSIASAEPTANDAFLNPSLAGPEFACGREAG